MKKIILTLIGFFLLALAIAQMPTPPQPNGNITNPSLDKFTGTWVWTNGSDSLKIILKKENILLPFPANSRADAIVGFHMYKQGNNIVENSINYVHTTYAANHSTILGGSSTGIGDPNKIVCVINNLTKNKSGQLTLTINASHSQLGWTLENSEGVRIGEYDFAFSFPLSLTLTRL